MDAELKLFRKTLKKNGYFNTKARYDLFRTLQASPALNIHDLLNELKSQDQATSYRNIKLFELLGIINRLQLGWNTKIELSDIFHHHHHHMTCLNCGKVIIMKDNQVLEAEIKRVSARRNFNAVDHQLEIRGYCSDCLRTNKPS